MAVKYSKEVAARIVKGLRTLHERSVEEVAEKSGVAAHTLRRIENASVANPSYEDLTNIGLYFKYSPSEWAALLEMYVLPDREELLGPEAREINSIVNYIMALPAEERAALLQTFNLYIEVYSRMRKPPKTEEASTLGLPEWAIRREVVGVEKT